VHQAYGTIRRLKLKAKLRHLRRNPGNVDRQMIENDREELSALILQLKQFQQTAGVAEPNSLIIQPLNSVDAWDDLAFDPVQIGIEQTAPIAESVNSNPSSGQSIPRSTTAPLPIEEQIIALPSNGNTSNVYKELELAHRVSTAEQQLNYIRNLIADKSFQYSHIIRVSPHKGVATRARAAVKKLNNQIAEYCRMYSRCRSCLEILGADDSILSTFKVLRPLDVAGSTAVLNPNEPGSTGIKLSWIWQTSARRFGFADNAESHADNPASLLECEFIPFHLDNVLNYSQFIVFIGCVLELN
jgi:hypothetical protein